MDKKEAPTFNRNLTFKLTLIPVGLSLIALFLFTANLVIYKFAERKTQIPALYEVGSTTFTVSPASINNLQNNQTVSVSLTMNTAGGRAETIAARITWDKTKFTPVAESMNVLADYNSVKTVNAEQGFAAVALIPVQSGSYLNVPSGNMTLFSINLKSITTGSASFGAEGSILLVDTPTPTATAKPTGTPKPTGTARPTATATARPTYHPTVKPTYQPTYKPTYKPTYQPTPTLKPSPTKFNFLKLGDLNGDDKINLLDVILEIDLIFGNASIGRGGIHPLANPDIDNNGEANINDVIAIINIIFGN